jgi:hypothetical protein
MDQWDKLQGKDWDIVVICAFPIKNTAIWTSDLNYHIDLVVTNAEGFQSFIDHKIPTIALFPNNELNLDTAKIALYNVEALDNPNNLDDFDLESQEMLRGLKLFNLDEITNQQKNQQNALNDVRTTKNFEEMSAFKNSPFGQYWKKNLPDWAVDYYGSARIISTSNIKFVDLTQTMSYNVADAYNNLLKGKIKPYQYTIYINRDGDGQKTLAQYNDPNIKPSANEVFVFIELDDGKFDFSKIVRVKLGENVVKDMQFAFLNDYLTEEELATEIISKVLSLKNQQQLTNDVKNSSDINNLLVRAIEFENGNKKFDDMSYFLLLLKGLEFFEFKSIAWLKSISEWLRDRKYKEEKYWNGNLDKGYEPAFLPTALFNKTKAEKEKFIKQMCNKPIAFIDEFVESQLKEKTVVRDFVASRLQVFKNQLAQKLKPFEQNLIEKLEFVESIETFIQYYNAFFVGLWNGVFEFIAGLIDLLGIIIVILKQEVGLRITDALFDKLENFCNFVYYDTQNSQLMLIKSPKVFKNKGSGLW